MSEQKSDLNQSKPFSGMRVLVAIAIGCSLGAAVAYFLKVLIDNTPAEIDLRRLRLFYLMVVTSGGLGGFAVATMRLPTASDATADSAEARLAPFGLELGDGHHRKNWLLLADLCSAIQAVQSKPRVTDIWKFKNNPKKQREVVKMELKFQVTDVSKPLIAVKRICENGNKVNFG